MTTRSLACAAWMVVAGVAGGCADGAGKPSQVFVWIEAETAVAVDADQIRVGVDRSDGESALAPVMAVELPVKLSLVPKDDDASREYTVTAEALDDETGAVIAVARLTSDFVAGETRHVRLVIEAACIGVLGCLPDETCHAGNCTSARVDSARFGLGENSAPNAADLLELDQPEAPDSGTGHEMPSGDSGMEELAPCSDRGARRCSAQGVPERCDGDHWAALTPCAAGDFCNAAPGATEGQCLPVLHECEDVTLNRAFCVDDVVRVCPNRVVFEDVACDTHARCLEAELGARCECNEGFVGDATTCLDSDECEQDNGGCDELTTCMNEIGGRSCSACPDQYAGDGETGCAPQLGSTDYREAPEAEPRTIGPGERLKVPLAVSGLELRASDVPTAASVTFDSTPVDADAWWPTPPLETGENTFHVVVSQPGHPSSDNALQIVRGKQEWYLKAPNTDPSDGFGQAVAITGPQSSTGWPPVGATVAIGAPYEDSSATIVNGDGADNTNYDSGAVYVITADEIGVAHEAYVKAANAGADDQFGMRVAIDENTLVVGAPNEDSDATAITSGANENAPDSGAVYVFTRNAGVWSQQAMLKANDAASGDKFGDAVALAGDTLIVAAPYEDSAATGTSGAGTDGSAPDSGAVYVFTRSAGVWSQRAYLKASNTGAGDRFGRGVGISGDTLVVGAVDEASAASGVGADQADDSAPSAGAAYVFTGSGGNWAQQAYLKADNAGTGDAFGYRVAIDDETVAVSAPFEASGMRGDGHDDSELEAGAVYVFVRAAGAWTQQAYLKAVVPVRYDWFGIGLALHGDRVLIGAAFDGGAVKGFGRDDRGDSVPQSGAIYLFERAALQWTDFAYAKAENAGPGDQFGYSVAFWRESLIVGARGESSSAAAPLLSPPPDGTNDDAPLAGAVYWLH